MKRYSFYKELDNLSTADFYAPKKKPRAQTSKEFFEIERVISKRIRNGKVSDWYICLRKFIHAFINLWNNSFFEKKKWIFVAVVL